MREGADLIANAVPLAARIAGGAADRGRVLPGYMMPSQINAETRINPHRDAGRPGRGARSSALRSVHTAGVASIILVIGRIRDLPRLACRRGAPGERQDDEERQNLSRPVRSHPA